MSDDQMEKDNGGEESFADLLESYGADILHDVQVGDRIRGKIISIGRKSVFLETGTKIDGIVDKAELLDENGDLPFSEGDMLELYAVSVDSNGIRLSRAIAGIGGLNLLKEAFDKQVPVEGRITGQCKGGFNVEVVQKRAFCPVSQVDLQFVENPADYVGKSFEFLIRQFEEYGRNIVLSRRELLDRELEKARGEFLGGLALGAQLEGRVTRLMPYGAFVELFPGVEGMVHISEISWSRVDRPEEVLNPEDSVQAKVIGLGEGDRPGRMKIALSIKQVTGDPWETVREKFEEGSKVTGKVTRCTGFGAFVEIGPGIEGLVHISEMS